MPGSVRIGYLNRADSPGTVTASTEAAGRPATNLQTDDIRVLWRATASPAFIILDMGQSLAVHCVALMRCNVIDPSTFRVRVSTSDPTGITGLVHDSGTLASPQVGTTWKKLVYIIDSAATGRYVRIDLTQASPLPEAGRLFVGRFWSPSSSMQYGWTPLWRDVSERMVALGNQMTFIRELEAERGIAFRLTHLTVAEARDEVNEINRRNGLKRDILIVTDRLSADLDQDTYWGLLEKPISYPQPDPLKFDALVTLWERL